MADEVMFDFIHNEAVSYVFENKDKLCDVSKSIFTLRYKFFFRLYSL